MSPRRAAQRLPSVGTVGRQRTVVSWLQSAIVVFFGLILTVYARDTAPRASSIALVVLLVSIIAAAVNPIIGLYAIVFFTLIGDGEASAWFPFAKSLSSTESLLYISDKLTFSPLEILIWSTFLCWVVERIGSPGARLVRGPMLYAVAAFTAFVTFGYLNGISRGGDIRIALFEGRDLFILLPVYLLASNLCGPRELRRLAWTAISAILINAFLAIKYLDQLTMLQQESREDLGEHSASVHFNVVILLTLVLFLYRGGSKGARFFMLAMCVPVGFIYLTAQRRSAVVALGVGIVMVLCSLWWRHRTKFWVITPLLFVLTVGYTGAFWNSTSGAGFPAQAIKTVVSPDAVSEKDRGSDLYRQIENFDINFTIRASPVTGLGFGHKFLQPVTLPDISFFEFYQYIPHNSIMWMWVKTGFLGFASMFLMFAVGIWAGVRSLLAERDPTNAAVIMIGLAYVVMFPIFAYVDIAWDPRSLVFLALSFGLCTFRQSEQIRRTPVRSIVPLPRPLLAPVQVPVSTS